MAGLENLNDATINFLSCTAGISFGLAGLTGAYEIFRRISPNIEYQKIFHSIVIISGVTTIASLLPLVFNESILFLEVSSYWLFCASLATFCLLAYQLFTKQVRLYFPKTTIALFFFTGIFIVFIPINAHLIKSIVIYKMFVLWGTFILSYRFFMFVRHIATMKSQAAENEQLRDQTVEVPLPTS